MIYKTYDELAGTKGETVLVGGLAVTRRFLLAADGVGFTLSDIRVKAGQVATLWYKNHIEANYVIEGEGTLVEFDTGTERPLAPGVMYCLDKHDRHRVIAKTDMRLICVFNPPLVGGESHDADGAYAAAV